MTHLVVTLRPEESIRDATQTLLTNGISGAPVVAEGRAIGIVSEADLLRAYAPPKDSDESASVPLIFPFRGSLIGVRNASTVADVMTTRVISISPDATVSEAAALIDRYGVRRLPVIRPDGYLAGIVARSDLVRALAEDVDLAASA